MKIKRVKILFLLLAFIPSFIPSAVPAPEFKWRNGGYTRELFNKGMYTSPALLDINHDGIAEVIWANFKVFAFDGSSGGIIWSFWAGRDRSNQNVPDPIIGTDTNVAVADINQDGFGEIITAHTNGLVCAYDRNGYFLPGFPLKPLGRTDPIGSLSVFDLDHDGDFEIIIGWSMANHLNICVIGHDGAIKTGWPQYVPNPNANALGIFGENIAVGDVNHDGFGELVVPSDTGKTCAYYRDGHPLPVNPVFNSWMTGWPDVVNYVNYDKEKFGWEPNGLFYMGTEQPATIADVNGDGAYEIIIVGVVYTNPDDWNFQPLYTKPFIYNLDRTRFKNAPYDWEGGLPQSGAPLSNDWQVIARKRTNPVVVDLDGDGKKEILSSSFDGKLHCYWLDKTEHGNWPFSIYAPAEGTIRFSSEPVVADLDGNGSLEVIFTSWPQYYSNTGGHLFILNSQGGLLHKITLPYGDNGNVGVQYFDGCLAAPSLGDVDGDNQVEIVLGTVYAGLVVYDLPGAVMGRAPWPTGRHDYARTGWTDYISNTDSIRVLSPNGGETWTGYDSRDITWSSTGTVGNVNIDYSTNNGGTWTSVAGSTANDGRYTWTVPNTPSTTCLARVSDTDGSPSDTSDAVFSIIAYVAETVSAPTTPAGPAAGAIGASYTYSTGGSTSSLGHLLQYKFDWDDGTDSGWLAVGTTGASHSWSSAGTYDVRAMARCVTHTAIESLWSNTHAIIIAGGSTENQYNSPSQYKVLPEVIWAPATGGGTWIAEVQVTDVSGGSRVSVFYNTATGRRGPFLLWDNSAGAALSSYKIGNLLETIDNLDTETFAYYGMVGAVEFITQDGNHKVQAAARTLNGNYAKTFSALSLHDANTAVIGRAMIIPNLANNNTYRSSCGFFNPTPNAVTMELRLLNAANAQVGNTISRTLSGYGFTAFSPFTEAGIPYPGTASDNIVLSVQPTSGSGKVVCFGASANNASNDPAAHVALQNGSGYDNGPSSLQILPEAIWALATGGGTWMSEVQVVDTTGGSVVSVYFDYGGGIRRGPFVLWNGGAAGTKLKLANILDQLGAIDSGFPYFSRVGTVEFTTQDGSHRVQVTARTLNGSYSKTFPGLNLVDAETADTNRMMMIQNFTNNSAYRSTCGFFNPTADVLTVEFTLLGGSGVQVGSKFSRTFVGHDFQSFIPFSEAGVPYPGSSYDNVILVVRPTAGTGKLVCFGASANNASNDPAAHLAVQGQ